MCREPNMELLFLEAKPIPSHAITALLAVIIGGIQLASAKGTRQHQLLGYVWVSMMMYVSISSFFISEIQLWGAFSPIHLLSAWTVFTLCTGVYFARWQHQSSPMEHGFALRIGATSHGAIYASA